MATDPESLFALRQLGDKDTQKLLRRLLRIHPVFHLQASSRSHVKVYWDKDLVCTVSATPSDHRHMANLKANLSRHGIALDEIPDRRGDFDTYSTHWAKIIERSDRGMLVEFNGRLWIARPQDD